MNYAVNLKKAAKTAREHLERVVEDAPGTPWALLANRELRDGFGIRVEKRFVPPPPPPKPGAKTAEPKPKARPKFANEAPPPPPPKPAVPKPPPVLPKL